MASDPPSPDLASPENPSDAKMILGDRRWGHSEAERTATFASARKWVGGLTLAAGAVLIWSLVYPHPYAVVIGILIALPLLALLPLIGFKGLVRFDGNRGNPYPDIVRPCFLPAIGLLIRGFKDVSIPSWPPLAIPIVGVALAVLAVLWVCARDVRAKANRMALAALFAFAYSTGAVIYAARLIAFFSSSARP